MSMKNFVLIGAAGYIAPRHLQAIKETGNNLVAAYDINDSVGILDSYFLDSEFFTNIKDLEIFLNEYKSKGNKIDYVSICSPNFMHKEHIEWAISNNSDVICEKPLVLTKKEILDLKNLEDNCSNKIFSILQLRLHDSVKELKDKISSFKSDKPIEVELTYITCRGRWYQKSWKGDGEKSGGIATNIGVHFFDMLYFIFGPCIESKVHYRDDLTTSGFLKYQNANVRWFLSIDEKNLPSETRSSGQRTFRSISFDNQIFDMSKGFTDLHTLSYQNILEGNAFGLDENEEAISIVENIRKSEVKIDQYLKHKLLKI